MVVTEVIDDQSLDQGEVSVVVGGTQARLDPKTHQAGGQVQREEAVPPGLAVEVPARDTSMTMVEVGAGTKTNVLAQEAGVDLEEKEAGVDLGRAANVIATLQMKTPKICPDVSLFSLTIIYVTIFIKKKILHLNFFCVLNMMKKLMF